MKWFKFTNPYFILICLIIVFAGIYLIVNDNEIKGLAMNLGSGFVGTLLTIFFIDRFNERSLERERNQYIKIAFNQLAREIRLHYNLLFSIVKSASVAPYPIDGESIKSVFTEDYFDAIKNFNFVSNSPVTPSRPWWVYMISEFDRMSETTARIIDIYSIHLGSETTAELEKFRNSDFVNYVKAHQIIINSMNQQQVVSQYPLFGISANLRLLKDHLENFLIIVDKCNSVSENKILFSTLDWDNNYPPYLGSSRL